MNVEQARALVVAELEKIAPEADFSMLDPNSDLREALDIDSLDFLRFVTALHKKSGINIPEADYRKLYTLAGVEGYLMDKSRT